LYTNPSASQAVASGNDADDAPVGVLVTNLGTPAAPTTAAVRRYLAEFLADPRVVELPRWLWLPILYGVILPVRPRRSAAAYRLVWTEDGSPLLVNARRQAAALEEVLNRGGRGAVKLALGMRYGEPSIASALTSLEQAGARRVLVLPLYPQYSASTTASTYDAVFATMARVRRIPELRLVCDYHDHPGYIEALAESVRAARRARPEGGRLLMSFHGLPQRYCDAGDPYELQCRETARRVAECLDEPADNWAVAFQSRVGREKWLQPYTEDVLREWAEAGVDRVEVLCPGFSADCLETLEEIAMRGEELFRASGGASLHYIPALNAEPKHIDALADIVLGRIRDWQQG